MGSNSNTKSCNCRVGRVPPRAGRGCGGHAEHGVVPAAGAARVPRDGERHPPRQPRQANVLRQRVQRRSRGQEEASLRPLAGLQRGGGAPHRHQRRRRLAQDLSVLATNTLLQQELVHSVNLSYPCSLVDSESLNIFVSDRLIPR